MDLDGLTLNLRCFLHADFAEYRARHTGVGRWPRCKVFAEVDFYYLVAGAPFGAAHTASELQVQLYLGADEHAGYLRHTAS